MIQRGARLRRSPFFDATLAAGCKSYTVYNHTLLPSFYDDPEAEYGHLLEHAALWDVAVERQVEVSGPDAFDFAQLLTPRDLATCAVGQGKYVVNGGRGRRDPQRPRPHAPRGRPVQVLTGGLRPPSMGPCEPRYPRPFRPSVRKA